ncbi:uncharacterized protein TNCV_1875461 [Trichonephila clavipes]|nr:uncharacterized protein TNCV_1875461 [Trichonephila clavipes]
MSQGSVTLTGVSWGPGSNLRGGMDVCKCIVPSRHGDTLNSRRAENPLVRLVGGKERWREREGPDYPQCDLPQNWGGKGLNCTVICMVLKATDNDKRHFAMMNSVDLDLAVADQVTLVKTTDLLIQNFSPPKLC